MDNVLKRQLLNTETSKSILSGNEGNWLCALGSFFRILVVFFLALLFVGSRSGLCWHLETKVDAKFPHALLKATSVGRGQRP